MNAIRRSFNAVKVDIIRFKKLMDDWVWFLHGNQKDMKARIEVLEQQVNELKKEKEGWAEISSMR